MKSDAESRKPKVNAEPFFLNSDPDAQVEQSWKRGVVMASCQNIVRRLSDMPANILTPVRFAAAAKELLQGLDSVEVICHDKAWATQQKMGAFLSVAEGSDQPPMFVEVHLKPSGKTIDGPVVLVGKGVCFDSGGISLKPSRSMDEMRADMAGAALVLSTIYGLAKLQTPLNREVIALMPMVENMPSGKATKPGDIVYSRSGKSIKIDNTDAEGRLILADALSYADDFSPSHVIDLATLTGAIRISLGSAAAGVFTNDDQLWTSLLKASIETGDRVWRLPLFQYFSSALKTSAADFDNISKPAMATMGGSSVAAAFLKEFTKCSSWAHVDIAGVAMGYSELTYLPSGMMG
ncbi:unnamed protein product [Soboliphyme baturini]|uniref:CYTOSOL_AP domain-containing protein n=1 Tax=Soboliphyme baturini TaxID=241478 RepID=A0A183IPX2_9BILA|nr:unnamed protein product [Soboliphyme baturini]